MRKSIVVGIILSGTLPVHAQTTGTGTIPRTPPVAEGRHAGQPIAEDEARQRLDAAGFHKVDDLAVDGAGIWRGTTEMNGKKISVAVDAKGQVLASGN